LCDLREVFARFFGDMAMIAEKNEPGPKEQPRTVSAEDWDVAVMHGQYSQGEGREDLVTFRRIDLASYLGQMRVESAGRIGVLRGILKSCKYPLLVAKADADSSGEQEDLEELAKLLRAIDAALRET
jgi:hypothetical protein